MSIAVLQVESAGLGVSIQDRGRTGSRRCGVPPSGCMDEHAAIWANRLLDNPTGAALLELQLQGARFTVRDTSWIAITGADLRCNLPTWRAVKVEEGEEIRFMENRAGVWAYLAVEDGIQAESILDSRSAYPRGRIGRTLTEGEVVSRYAAHGFELPPGVAGRTVPWTERRDYSKPPVIHVYPGPQWDLFTEAEQKKLFTTEWTVSSQSDRAGYRLSGPALHPQTPEIVSEPVRTGSIQVPMNGQPIITMRDGPTVGGYPKIGLIDRQDLSWIAQCRPRQKLRFQKAE